MSGAITVCESGCDFAAIDAAVESVLPGGSATIVVSAGNYTQDHAVGVVGGTQLEFRTDGGSVTVTNSGTGPVFYVSGANSALNLDGFSLTAVNDRALQVVGGGAAVVDNGVLFTIGLQDKGGAILLDGAALFSATGTLFLNNVATGDGGQILAVNSDVELVECRFAGGYAERGGGVAFARVPPDAGPAPDIPTLTISGGQFEDNIALDAGGALFLSGHVEVTIEGTEFVGNSTEGVGGAVADEYLAPAEDDLAGLPITAAVTGARFEGNVAATNGGAIQLLSTLLYGADLDVRHNSAAQGGALFLGAAGNLVGSTFCENAATTFGGAVYTSALSAQYWTNDRFLSNTGSAGGAIASTGGDLVLLQSNLLGNAASSGAAVLASDVHLDSTIIGFNTSSAAIVAPQIVTVHSLFWSNAVGDYRAEEEASIDDETWFDVDPLLEHYVPLFGCDAADDYYNFRGPLVDHGNPRHDQDPDGSLPDIGAYGGLGPEGGGPWEINADHDPALAVYDCVDGDATIYPDALDLAHDGIDQNCDLADDYDIDLDGWPYPTDCDDADPERNPGADDQVDKDGNCDGVIDFDGDGSPLGSDCDDTDPDVHPGAQEDPRRRDLDCVGARDVPRTLQPVTCSAAGGPGAWGWIGALVAAVGGWLRARSGLGHRRPLGSAHGIGPVRRLSSTR